ncbi:TolB [Vibrio metschnikovii]|uniref:TolB n=1 Tax=Vibrio metschnikovii TaxID=28172 RepID=UPI001C2FB40A|nr:TolB [Vibrio metschnikovii]
MSKTLALSPIMGLMACLGLHSPHVLAEPVAWDQAGQVWQTQQSAHFIVHFRRELANSAARALDIAEQVHQELASQFAQMPAEKTHLTLVDDYDYSNGWATPLPYAQIRLIINPPSTVNGLEGNDEWLHLLIRHEYTHIIHMEMSDGAVTIGRGIVGRHPLLFPHALTPSMLLEGLAVYMESQNDHGVGRLHNSHFAMQMRMEVASGELADIEHVVVAHKRLPFGSNYLYGAYFVQYLAKTYGEESVQAFLTDYSGYLVPGLFLNLSARHIFGKDFFALWEEFRADLNTQFAEQLTSNEAFTYHELDAQPFEYLLAHDRDTLIAWRQNGDDRANLAQWDTKRGQWQSLVSTKSLTSIDSHPTQGLVVSQINSYVDGRVFNDLYRYVDGQWQRLTEQQRFVQARWSNDGQSLFAVRHQQGLAELWQIELNGKQTQLWQGEANWVLGDMAVSPNGDIYAAVKAPFQSWNIMRFDQPTQSWILVTETAATEHQLSFTAQGDLLFSADYTGRYQIYRLDLKTNIVEQLTAEIGGAFSPQSGPEGIVYQAYEHDGYHLRRVENPQGLADIPLSTLPVANTVNAAPIATIAAIEKSQPTGYSPLSTLAPRYWMPVWQSDNNQSLFGVATSGSDVLGRHQYEIMAAWDSKNAFAAYQLGYQYDNRWQATLSREHEFKFNALTGKDDRIVRQDDFTLQRNHLWHGFDDHLNVGVGTYWQKEALVKSPQGSHYADASNEWLAGGAIQWDNREGLLNIPGYAWGHYADLVWETNIDGDYSGQKWQAQWQANWDLPGRLRLTTHLAAGYADAKAKPFELGGYTGDEAQLYGRNELKLRGYGSAAQVGQQYATQSIELSRLLYRAERNWGLWPIGLGDISATAFVDSGSSWNSQQSYSALTGIGAELQVDAIVLYGNVLPIRIGYAHGLDSKLGKDEVYIKLAVEF